MKRGAGITRPNKWLNYTQPELMEGLQVPSHMLSRGRNFFEVCNLSYLSLCVTRLPDIYGTTQGQCSLGLFDFLKAVRLNFYSFRSIILHDPNVLFQPLLMKILKHI